MSRDMYDDAGLVDAFGLDEFGNPVGLGAGWGMVIGGGAGALTAVTVRHLADPTTHPKWRVYSEIVGLGASVLAGGIMSIFRSTRHAGMIAMLTGAVTNGVRGLDDIITFYALKKPAEGVSPPVSGAELGQLVDQRLKQLGLGQLAAQTPKMLGEPSGVEVLGATGPSKRVEVLGQHPGGIGVAHAYGSHPAMGAM